MDIVDLLQDEFLRVAVESVEAVFEDSVFLLFLEVGVCGALEFVKDFCLVSIF